MSVNLGLLRKSMYQSLTLLAEMECPTCVGCDAATEEPHDQMCWVGRSIAATDSAIMMLDERVTHAAVDGVAP